VARRRQRSSIRLLQAPVISVTTVVEAYGAGYNRTLTKQPLDAGAFDAFGYTVDLVDGCSRVASPGSGPFVGGRRNIHVVYVAGRATIPAQPDPRHPPARPLAVAERDARAAPTGQGPEQVAYTPSGFAVPNAVIELCAAKPGPAWDRLMAQGVSADLGRAVRGAQGLFPARGSWSAKATQATTSPT
jgi:hypothetical protein